MYVICIAEHYNLSTLYYIHIKMATCRVCCKSKSQKNVYLQITVTLRENDCPLLDIISQILWYLAHRPGLGFIRKREPLVHAQRELWVEAS